MSPLCCQMNVLKEYAVIRIPRSAIRYLAGAGVLLTAYLVASIVSAQIMGTRVAN